jgi:hypothetical protein
MLCTAPSTPPKTVRVFYNYYKDISKRVKEREKKSFQDKDRVDILLVVNMYLTGFDAKKVNTLYVDKNLRHHGLIQAFSRTNRILGEVKSHGNIVCFRNLKEKTDAAITLFSNPEAKDEVLMKPYERVRRGLQRRPRKTAGTHTHRRQRKRPPQRRGGARVCQGFPGIDASEATYCPAFPASALVTWTMEEQLRRLQKQVPRPPRQGQKPYRQREGLHPR